MWILQKFLLSLPSYLTILLALVAIIGDHMIIRSRAQIALAIIDNSTHFIIGGLSWVIICLREHHKNNSSFQTILEGAGCALIASLIDLDHFVAAKSFNLKDATSLKSRPPLHCSTFPLLICSLLLLMSYVFEIYIMKRSALIVLTAFASHHTRDAARRGYWFYPYGSTPPVPYVIYIIFTCLIPYLITIFSNLQESAPVGTHLSRLLI